MIWTISILMFYFINYFSRCDLSISAGSKAVATGDPVSSLENLQKYILSDDSQQCWEDLQNEENNCVVSIVMDNCGFELFTDLCLADFLINSGVVKKVRLRIKNQPWFVSDTTPSDLTWTLNQLMSCGQDSVLTKLANRWQEYINANVWTTHSDQFWTYPHSYHEMSETDPELFKDLSTDSLVIFKGDLNYRKLVGDLNWETVASFPDALKEFRPSKILAIRTAKADVMVGLESGQAETTTEQDPTWMITGQWGVLQYAGHLKN